MSLWLSRADRPERVEHIFAVDADDETAALLQRFGEPEPVMMLKLDGSRKLARADAEQVAAEIRDKGFYLQMPPGPAELKQAEP